jgi:hypothetical protein
VQRPGTNDPESGQICAQLDGSIGPVLPSRHVVAIAFCGAVVGKSVESSGQQGSWQFGARILPSTGHKLAQPESSGSTLDDGHGNMHPRGSMALGSAELGHIIAHLPGYFGAGNPPISQTPANSGRQHGSTHRVPTVSIPEGQTLTQSAGAFGWLQGSRHPSGFT